MTAAACGTSGNSGGFLAEVHAAAPTITTYRNDTELVRLGHVACDGFAAGASYEQLADRMSLLEGSAALPSPDLGAVITAAADNFCPKYRNRIGQ